MSHFPTATGLRAARLFLLLAVPLLAVPLLAACAQTGETATKDVVVTPVIATGVTATGQPIMLPQQDTEVVASTYDIAPGAALPVHKHPYPRYAYVMAGTLQVDYLDAGKSEIYRTGDFIAEAVGQWHKGANIGSDHVQLIVLDMIPKGAKNVILHTE